MSIEKFPESSFFENFPRGCCGDTSILLHKFLIENNIVTEYVWGMKRSNQSHAWLECQEWIIDITADQFDNIQEKVLITMDRTWHSRFKERGRTLKGFNTYDYNNRNRLSTIYRNIKANL